MLNFCWVSIFFDILIANISWTVAQAPINHIIFWKTVIRTSRCTYINYFNSLFWPAKYLNFGQKLPIRTAHHAFIESRHLDVTKNPYYVLFPKGSQKKVSAHGLIPVCRGAYIPYFKVNSTIFCCPFFSENHLNPQVRIKKMVIKINYWPLYLRVEKLNLFIFTHNLKQDSTPSFYHYSPVKRKLPIPPKQHFLKIFFLSRKEGRDEYGAETISKIKPTRALITSYDKFHHLCSLYNFGVFLCHNLDSSMLKCEGSLA